MQKKKNIYLLSLLLLVITLITILSLFKKNKRGLPVDKKMFTLEENTVITDVILKSKVTVNTLSYMKDEWLINNTYKVDNNMRDVFFSILSKMEIKRVVARSKNDSIAQLSKKNGVHLSILDNQKLLLEYWILGDINSQTSYLTDTNNQSYIIHLPGYRSYLAGIFEVPESDWRTRRIFSSLFTNLNSLKVNYKEEEVIFRYKDNFFEIDGVDADSSQLISSLEKLLFLQANQFLQPTEHSKYIDSSFTDQKPIVSIFVENLSGNKEVSYIFNTKKEKNVYWGVTPDSSYCLFNKKYINTLLSEISKFN